VNDPHTAQPSTSIYPEPPSPNKKCEALDSVTLIDFIDPSYGKRHGGRSIMNESTSTRVFSPAEQPATPIEKAIGEIVLEFLGYEIGRSEDFFAIGLSSLTMMQIFSRVQTKFDIELELEAAFDNATLAEIALLIEGALTRRVSLLTDDEAAILLSQDGNV
jgi:acyl carrier protein